MLELRSYSKAELEEIFGPNNNQNLKNKLERMGIVCECTGTGEKKMYTIKEIRSKFKVFLITELGFTNKIDFKKAAYFYYILFNDMGDFMSMPYLVKESRMEKLGCKVSRQTIKNYMTKIEEKNWIYNTGEYIYYFANKNEQRKTTHEEYKKAWNEFFKDAEEMESINAGFYFMKDRYGGIAKKKPVLECNGMVMKQIETLCDYAKIEIEKDCEDFTEAFKEMQEAKFAEEELVFETVA